MAERNALLALEFSGRQSSVALAIGDGSETRYLQRQSEGPRGRYLLQEVDLLMQEAGLERTAIGGVIAGIGPGSYTGLRIACAAAHALGFALGVPYAGIGSFEAALFSAPEGAKVHIVQDAYRQEAYYASGRHQNGQTVLSDGPRVLLMAELPTDMSADDYLICDDRLQGKLQRPENALLRPQARDLLKIAMHRGAHANGGKWAELAPAEPLYLRAAAFRPQAK